MKAERRFQVNYSDGVENIVLSTDLNIQAIKRNLSKKKVVGNAVIFDRETDRVTYYKPRYHQRTITPKQ